MTVTSIEKDQTITQQDTELFNSFLEKSKNFKIESKTKSGIYNQSFPLYFGTTEDEINPHRLLAFHQKRIAILNNNSNNNNNKIVSKPLLKSEQSTNSPISSSTDSTIITEPSSISSISSNAKEDPIVEKQKEQPSATSSPITTTTPLNKPIVKQSLTPDPVTPVNSPSVKQSSTFKSAPVTPASATSSVAPKLTFADMLKKTKSQQNSNNSSASHSRSQSNSTTISKTNIKNSSNGSTTSNLKKSVYETISDNFKTNPKNALPITLLRIMFDSKFINKIYSGDSQSLIYPHGLQNSGNICYMNSILQFLFYCNPFSEMLNIIRENTFKDLDDKNSTTPILNALLDLQDSFRINSNANTNNSSSSSSSSSSESDASSESPSPNDIFAPLKCDIINPDKFYTQISSLPRFSHLSWGQQEDAEEFLNNLLDGLHEEFIQSIKTLSSIDVLEFSNAFSDKDLSRKIVQTVDFINDLVKNNSSNSDNDSWNEVGSNMKTIGKRSFQVKLSPIVNLFGGQFKSVLKNSNKKSSITLDPFMQLQLDISDIETNDLITAFEKFSQDEEISLGSTMAKKQNFIDKLPSVLIIHLKRFSFVTNDEHNSENNEFEVVNSKKNKKNNNNNKQFQTHSQFNDQSSKFDGRIEKIHKFIKYNHNLTLPKSCISTMVNEEPNYKLLGVVYHHGRSTENGHYTADMLTSNNQWVRLDDTNITRISPNDAIADQNEKTNINKTAYILMYQKV